MHMVTGTEINQYTHSIRTVTCYSNSGYKLARKYEPNLLPKLYRTTSTIHIPVPKLLNGYRRQIKVKISRLLVASVVSCFHILKAQKLMWQPMEQQIKTRSRLV